MEPNKKEAALISAAVFAHLAKQGSNQSSHSTSEIQKTLEQLLEKVSQLEKRVDELSSAVNEIKQSAKSRKK
jgi:methyl-accepting chemotaxis protein